ncbi:MAG: hypothetical protein WBE26_17355 [Phycisphaerae bacterium]
MSQIAAGPPMNPMVLAVAAFVIVAVLISFGNKRQRPILWAALFVSVIMVLFPPWVGEKGRWVDAPQTLGRHDPQYVRLPVSVGYALIFRPPQRVYGITNASIRINWSRLLIQIGVMGLITGGLVLAFKIKLTS